MDELFAEIDRSLAIGRTEVDERKAAEGAQWLKRIEDENADELTPERLAAMEAAAARADDGDEAAAVTDALLEPRVTLGEDVSPTAGRRFTRA